MCHCVQKRFHICLNSVQWILKWTCDNCSFILGFQHGPPHLTNLMVQPGQHQALPVTSAASQPVTEPVQPLPQQQVYPGQVTSMV